MEIKKEDTIIQIILDQLCLYEYSLTNHKLISEVYSDAFRGDENTVYNKLLYEYKLIKRKEKQNGYYKLTDLGNEVQKNRGWVKYKEKQERLINRKNKKDNYDYLFSKWRYKTYWLLLVCSVLASGYSLYDFIDRFVSKDKEEKIEKLSNIYTEQKQDKLHISILNQENLDSLYDYKNHDSLKKAKLTK